MGDAASLGYRSRRLPRAGWFNQAAHQPTSPSSRRFDGALTVLGTKPERSLVAQAVLGWNAEALETTIVAADGVAAAMQPHLAEDGRGVGVQLHRTGESFYSGRIDDRLMARPLDIAAFRQDDGSYMSFDR